jgi:hypothetical protein
MASCTSGAIALRPSGNAQGSYYFLNLNSGKCIIRNNWTVLHMPNEVINTIHQLAAACNKYKGIVFTDKEGNIINDMNNEEDNTVGNIKITEGNIETTGAEDNTGVDYDNDEGVAYSPSTDNRNTEVTGVNDETYSPDIIDNQTYSPDIIDNPLESETYGPSEDTADISNVNHNINTANDDISIEGELPDDTYVTIDNINIVREMNSLQLNTDPITGEERDGEAINNSHRYNLRPRPTTRNQKYTLAQINNQLNMPKTHAHIMMTQLNVKEGIRQFGEKGNEALLKELNQLHERQALMPKKKEDMSYEERKKALRYLMFIKEKRDGTIKARGCADGRSQREYTDKADTSSPTVSLEAMLLTCATDAK